MEFDSIFITGATEDEFPSFFSVRDSNLRRKDDCFIAMTKQNKDYLYQLTQGILRGFQIP